MIAKAEPSKRMLITGVSFSTTTVNVSIVKTVYDEMYTKGKFSALVVLEEDDCVVWSRYMATELLINYYDGTKTP
jgi:hypothetical protein